MSELDKQVGIMETKVKDHERRIRIQEEKNETLSELSTYVKLQYEHNKKTDERFEQMTKVLDGINTSLLSLNHDVKFVKESQEVLDSRVGGLEEEQTEALKKFKNISLTTSLKIVTGIAIPIIVAIILFWLNIK